ncbi:hypothetical protein EC957_003894 [Mortierella hygrophila]|uniref:Uncharacterized protein n=1 Tax=Mortierella hygrophila TaxID=979708 RepID=A0A9P6K0P6_9FUNG|nr:hypothetical protein EC957_003894 [Mortierella hygrophila]
MTCLLITTAAANTKANGITIMLRKQSKGDVGGDTSRSQGLPDAHAQDGAEDQKWEAILAKVQPIKKQNQELRVEGEEL